MVVADQHHVVRKVTGVIQHVDVARREVAVLADGDAQVFDVRPGCPCHLHGEPVKLRLLLPGDAVRITYTREGNGLIAHSLRVGEGRGPRTAGDG